jgi:hypothetical protein
MCKDEVVSVAEWTYALAWWREILSTLRKVLALNT